MSEAMDRSHKEIQKRIKKVVGLVLIEVSKV